ncbi:hypothetical protein [Imhoffiella purpurea]|uniref:Uncharacterized protein n=1 Tax=Imhoffiella purpurea TaxID=1249627 RepID=W9VBM8_9GAMM|nr:hypothetical protein [Imhoffiella purpurea]EXJ13447.1 hypothetical protein D779_3709 [Imhoffiella purpurea]
MGSDNRGDLRLFGILLLAVVLLLAAVVLVLLPAAAPVVATLDEGMGLKAAVPWGFGVTVGLFVLFALVAGDGLIGELQFMLGSFFSFFLVLTLLIAWVF